MESHLRCLFFALNSRSLYNITQPWDNTGVARLCLAHWYYRTRTKPAEVREAPTSIGGGGCHFLRKIVLKINLTSGPQ